MTRLQTHAHARQTYAFIDVIGEVNNVEDLITVIGRRYGSIVIVLATGEDFARVVLDDNVVAIKKKDYVIIGIDHKASAIINVNGKDLALESDR